jgi:hypothetical protein
MKWATLLLALLLAVPANAKTFTADYEVGQVLEDTYIACRNKSDIQSLILVKLQYGFPQFLIAAKRWMSEERCTLIHDPVVEGVDDVYYRHVSNYNVYEFRALLIRGMDVSKKHYGKERLWYTVKGPQHNPEMVGTVAKDEYKRQGLHQKVGAV